MTAHVGSALGLVIAAAVGYGVASVAQAAGARRSSSTLRTLRTPIYLAGVAADCLAWLASLVALRTLPVYEVQAVLAGSLAVTVVTARLVLATPLRRRGVVAIMVAVVALTAVALSAGPQRVVEASPARAAALVGAAVLLALAGWAATRSGSAVLSAALAGAAFGTTALCARALVLPDDPLRHVGATVAGAATAPIGWALAGSGVTGMLLYARALRLGQVAAVTTVLWVVEVAGPSVIGVAFFGDTVRAGWAPWAALAVLAMVAASAVLAVEVRGDTEWVG